MKSSAGRVFISRRFAESSKIQIWSDEGLDMEKLFESQGSLGLFLIFFIPGFITLKVYDLLIPGEQRDFSKSLFDAVAYSSLNFAALLWLIAVVESGNLRPWQWYTAIFFLLVGMPAVWPVVFLLLRSHPWVARRIASPHPRVWDDIFQGELRTGSLFILRTNEELAAFTGKNRSRHIVQLRPRFILRRCGTWTMTASSQAR